MSNEVILFIGDVTEELVTETIKEIQSSESEEITLILQSFGGHAQLAILFYDFILQSKKSLTVITSGSCFSSGIIILCAAKKRVASKRTSFLIHQVKRFFKEVDFTYEEMLSEAKKMRVINETYIDILVKTTGRTREEIETIFYKESQLTAQEAFELGLLTEKPTD